MNYFLLGFMGSGKSTVGRLLAQAQKMTFVDLDAYIETATRKSIGTIFSEMGEDKFRELEHHYLKEIIQNNNQIISLGGGAPCFHSNMEMMNKHGITIYLKLSDNALLDRLLSLSSSAIAQRPLIANKTKSELQEYISLTLQKREPFYEQAKIIVFNEGSDSSRTIERIKMAISNKYN